MKSRLALACAGVLLTGSVLWFFRANEATPRDDTGGHASHIAPPSPPETTRPNAGLPATPPAAGWQKAVNDVLGAGEDPSTTCRKLVGLVKDTPPAAQLELAQHILNLASGDDFRELMPLMKDRTLGVKFHRRIALGLLNQREDIKLRGVLDIASSDWHPMTQQFRTLLPVLTGEDAGEDMAAWKSIVEKQITEWEAEQQAKTSPAPTETTPTPSGSQ